MKKKKKVNHKHQRDEEDVYIRIDPDNSAETKKQLLEITASFIKIQMIYEKLKNFGKKEIAYRNAAKRDIKSINTLINQITTDMPKIKIPREITKIEEAELKGEKELVLSAMRTAEEAMRGGKKYETSKTATKKPKKLTLNQELMEIKRKLANI